MNCKLLRVALPLAISESFFYITPAGCSCTRGRQKQAQRRQQPQASSLDEATACRP
eukprot:NODE_10677_length_299_cov_166.684426.p4 GENE.NODE_10677_length_299_cov_166.684426~~NODE_10677_length_299_cov_166.684426.p4  ORF type:complete len:56 (+),score=6.74 NODE_10677_length_299_cov_166.684426:55-222(+)